MKNRAVKYFLAWLPVFLWSLMIFKFSSGSVPSASDIFWQDFAFKKFGHLILFGILSILLYRAFRISGLSQKDAILFSFFMTFFYGATDEFHQGFTQGRESRIRDVFIDGIGSVIFLSALRFSHKNMGKKIYTMLTSINLN